MFTMHEILYTYERDILQSAYPRNLYEIYLSMEVVRKLKCHKVFHLIDDNTSTVPEKVFLV